MGGRGANCVLLTAKGIGPGTIIFCFHFFYVVFYCQRGEWARDNYFSFMGGGMRGKETERLFLCRVVL